jgi:uncharacterized protein YjiS (DUF1127 family)
MRQMQDVLHLHFECQCANRGTTCIIGASPTIVSDYLARQARLAELSAARGDDLGVTRTRLVPAQRTIAGAKSHAEQAAAAHELPCKGVAPELLWQEYNAKQPDGFQDSAFFGHSQNWRQSSRYRCARPIPRVRSWRERR